ncbi:MAG: hypothetical protein AAGC71_00335 [Pseudomonadota bacterium]
MDEDFPDTLSIGSGVLRTVYRRASQLAAKPRNAVSPSDAVLSESLAEHVLIDALAAERVANRDAVLPVYQSESGVDCAVATGRLFVRTVDGGPIDKVRRALAELGLTVEQINDWAPHSGWVRPTAGAAGVAIALRIAAGGAPGLDIHVEPELLRTRTPKVAAE